MAAKRPSPSAAEKEPVWRGNPALKGFLVPVASLHEDPANARRHGERNTRAILASYAEFGQQKPIVATKAGKVIAGNGQLAVVRGMGWSHVAVVTFDSEDEARAMAFAIADNRTSELAEWDPAVLAAQLEKLKELDFDVDALLAFDDSETAALLGAASEEDREAARLSLAERFLVPPFSVLDARQGYWRERKSAWLALGIKSEVGRGENLLHMSDTVLSGGKKNAGYKKGGTAAVRRTRPAFSGQPGHQSTDGAKGRAFNGGASPALEGWSGTSVFDPVLCEIACRWFCPAGGAVLDPFAGGSVRGIVAASLGLHYVGVDLRPEQIAANEEQARTILGKGRPAMPRPKGDKRVTNPHELTPVHEAGGFFFKRDDLFDLGGANGGKARALAVLLLEGPERPEGTVIVTCCSRQSPHQERVALACRALGLRARIHIPAGESTPETLAAEQAGAEIVRHDHGRLSVLKARANQDAAENRGLLVPWAMEHEAAVAATAAQVKNIPKSVKRVVVPTGSGMTLAGILHGLEAEGRTDVKVLAVSVGAGWRERVHRFGPVGYEARVEEAKSPLRYEQFAPSATLAGIKLDPQYEAKCIPFMQPGDLLWCVGSRQDTDPLEVGSGSARWICGDSKDEVPKLEAAFDLVFTCPPYFDLEQYSDDPRDLSNAETYHDFMRALENIVASAATKLKDNRFAIVAVGEVRADGSGAYRGLVPDTIHAFEKAGLAFYNEAILVTPVGSLPIRVAKMFGPSRKLGKTHQNVLVFIKGDPVIASEACGAAETGEPEEAPEEGEVP